MNSWRVIHCPTKYGFVKTFTLLRLGVNTFFLSQKFIDEIFSAYCKVNNRTQFQSYSNKTVRYQMQ